MTGRMQDGGRNKDRRIPGRKTILLLWVLVCIFLSSCVSPETTPKKSRQIKIGMTLYDQYDVFISELVQAMNQAILRKRTETGREVVLEIYHAARNQSTQNQQVEEMIADGCDVICVNLVDRTAPGDIIDMARKADTPLIFFNRELVAEDLLRWDKLYYVGADAFESGIMQGELAAEMVQEGKVDKNNDGSIQYVVLEGEAGHQDAIARSETSVNRLIEMNIRLEKLGYGIANWDRAQAHAQMAKFIEEFGSRIELVLANNDDMALGAIDAYASNKIPIEERPKIFGVDGTLAGRQAVKDGTLSGTVYNDANGQANAMCNLAFQLATDGSLQGLNMEGDRYIRLPYSKITHDNIEAFENK